MGMTDDGRDELIAGAGAFGLALSEDQVRKFERLLDLLADWNTRINLTRIPPEKGVSLHLLDSLSVLTAIQEWPRPNAGKPRLLDVGTGAGFPGLPLAIARPDIDVSMIDGTAKKIRFVATVIEELALQNARALHVRAEDILTKEKGRVYDYVVCRAVASLDKLIPLLLPLTGKSGAIFAMKSSEIDGELEAGRRVAAGLDAHIADVRTIELPGDEKLGRKIVVVSRK